MCLAILAQPPGSFGYSRRHDVTACVIFAPAGKPPAVRSALACGAEPLDVPCVESTVWSAPMGARYHFTDAR